MNRQGRWAAGAIGAALAVAGCSSSHMSKVRETAVPDAQSIHADAPNLLPAMPLAGTGATRGQAPEQPRPSNGITTTSATTPTGTLPPSPGQVAVRIRAHVNGQPILEKEIREDMVMRMGDIAKAQDAAERAALVKEIAAKELDRIVERELILQDALMKIKEIKKPQLLEELKRMAAKEADRRIADVKKSMKIADDAEFRQVMAKSGLPVDGFRRHIERNVMTQAYMGDLIGTTVQRISLQQVKDYYDDHPDQFTSADRVRWLDLFVDASRFPSPMAARQHAEMLAQRARAGEDFAGLVKQFDHGDSSLRNGDGLGQKPGEIRPSQVESVVMSLKPNEVGPLIDVGFGFHVVKVVEREYAGREPFDEKTQTKAREKLRTNIAEREYKRFVDELKRKSTVVIYPN